MAPDLMGAVWRTSSRSGGNGQCVEVAFVENATTAVRDSKNPNGGVLLFNEAPFAAFLAVAKAGSTSR